MSNLPVYDSQEIRLGLVSTFRELWSRRELISLLVNRDLTVRYKRSVIGIFWTLLNPLLTTTVLWFVFVRLFGAKLPDGQQYAPYVLSGVLVLTFFNQGFSQAADSLTLAYQIISKVHVPPQVFAFSSSISSSLNFGIGCIALVFISILTGEGIGFTAPLAIVFVLCMIFYVTGLGLAVTTLYVRFDDSRNIVVVLLQLMTYLTPIFYPKTLLSGPVLYIVNLNPLTSYLEVFRATFCNTGIATLFDWVYMIITSLIVVLIGTKIFMKNWPKLIAMI